MVEHWTFNPLVLGSTPNTLIAIAVSLLWWKGKHGGLKNRCLGLLVQIQLGVGFGVWPSGKASVFGTEIQRFDPFYSNGCSLGGKVNTADLKFAPLRLSVQIR